MTNYIDTSPKKPPLVSRLGRRVVARRPPRLLALAVALLIGEPVAIPRPVCVAALLHGHLMERADRRRAVGGWRARARRGRRWRAGLLARSGGLAGAGGLLCCQDLLHRLLDEDLQVGGWGGRLGCRRGRSCWGRVRGFALLAEGVEVNLPLPCLVEHSLHPWHQVLHAAGQLGVADVTHGAY